MPLRKKLQLAAIWADPGTNGALTLQERNPLTALLRQEGRAIAFFAMTRGVVPKGNFSECIHKQFGFGTTPRTISTEVSFVLPSFCVMKTRYFQPATLTYILLQNRGGPYGVQTFDSDFSARSLCAIRTRGSRTDR